MRNTVHLRRQHLQKAPKRRRQRQPASPRSRGRPPAGALGRIDRGGYHGWLDGASRPSQRHFARGAAGRGRAFDRRTRRRGSIRSRCSPPRRSRRPSMRSRWCQLGPPGADRAASSRSARRTCSAACRASGSASAPTRRRPRSTSAACRTSAASRSWSTARGRISSAPAITPTASSSSIRNWSPRSTWRADRSPTSTARARSAAWSRSAPRTSRTC